jgi:hypothetical protein
VKLYAIAALAVLGAMLSGCVADTIPIEYTPSSTLSASGAVKVGDFTYLPAIQGKMKPNQIHNTALGTILLDKNVDVFFHNAVFTELRFVGVKVGTGDRTLSGEIREFLIDDLGYSVDWTIDVDYKVTDASGAVVYRAEKSAKNRTSKFANALGALSQQIKLNIEALIQDPAFIKAIN